MAIVAAPEHKIVVSKQVVEPASKWCQERWGKRWSAVDYHEGTWCCFWAGFRGPDSGKHAGMYIFHFDTETQALEFALRWQ